MFEKEMEMMKKTLKEVEEGSHSIAYETLSFFKKIIIALIIFIFLNNVCWLIYISDFEYSVDTISQEQTETINSSMNGEIN